MQLDGAIIDEQGVTFAIVVVKTGVLQTRSRSDQVRESLALIQDFSELPIVLAAQDAKGRFTYQGRHDIVDFLASIDASRIPWKTYSVG